MISLRISIVAAVVLVGVLAVYVLQVVAYSLVGASFDSVVLNVYNNPQTILFNNDGTVLYVAAQGASNIYAYTLTNAYDISTASSDSLVLDLSDTEDIVFNDDGTVLYVLGYGSKDIKAYNLTTAYDISTASFDSVVLDVSGQEGGPENLLFNNDGTILYVLGSTDDEINAYNLTTAYDISTASFDSVVLDVSGQEAVPNDFLFNDDGTVLYVLGAAGDDINAYNLTTAYDISTALFNDVVLYVGSQESTPQGMSFNNDGTVLYVLGNDGDDINAYNLFSGSTTFTTNVDFEETLYVLDTISKGSGSFVIDHPVDPRNKLLYHSFVESPDAKNLYDGTAVLDAAGEVVVELPDYTSALNKDFRYQVKAIDQPAPNIHIKEEVNDNQFTIAGGPAGARVSWQVTGIRQDPYILANPIIPVVEKGPNQLVDKGEYLFAGYESFGDKVSSFFEKALDLLERLWDIFMEFMLSLRLR